MKLFLKIIATPASYIATIHSESKHFEVKLDDKTTLAADLYDPFPSGQNPHYKSAKLHCRTWILSQELFSESDAGFKKFIAGDFAKLAAYCYRSESESDLHLVTDFIAWLFKHDDFRDSNDTPIGKDPEKIEQMNILLEKVLTSGILPSPTTPIICEFPIIYNIATSLLDIRTRLVLRVLDHDISHFIKSIKKYFQANIWEARNREAHTVPTSTNYQQWRKYTSAVMPTYEIGYLLRGIKLPDEIREDINFESITNNSSNAVCFTNDLFSLKKELNDGVVENYVFVRMKEDNLTAPQAFVKVAKLTDEEVRQYLRIKNINKKLHKEYPQVFDLQETWVDGNLRWSIETKRYK